MRGGSINNRNMRNSVRDTKIQKLYDHLSYVIVPKLRIHKVEEEIRKIIPKLVKVMATQVDVVAADD